MGGRRDWESQCASGSQDAFRRYIVYCFFCIILRPSVCFNKSSKWIFFESMFFLLNLAFGGWNAHLMLNTISASAYYRDVLYLYWCIRWSDSYKGKPPSKFLTHYWAVLQQCRSYSSIKLHLNVSARASLTYHNSSFSRTLSASIS